MRLHVLEKKQLDNNRSWLVGRVKLEDYLQAVDEDRDNKFNFEVQRKIVRNIYLDTLLNTIENGEPMPLITLTAKIDFGVSNEINIDRFEILDGLQRTYRLWAYWKICKYMAELNHSRDIREFAMQVKSRFPEPFEKRIVNSKILHKVFDNHENLLYAFQNYDLYVIIWANLSELEIIKKMLVLNAGQKPVSSKHQFELIFLHLIKEISDFLEKKRIKIYREKDKEFSRIKKERKPGEYAFSTIVTSLLSLATGKPQRVSSELIYKYDLMDEDKSLSYARDIFTKDFMENILEVMLNIDKKYQNDKKALLWLGKDTTLTGMFAAVGKYIGFDREKIFSEFPKEKVLDTFYRLVDLLPENLEIDKFNEHYDSLAGRSLNIGNYIRQVILYWTLQLLQSNKISWEEAFKSLESGRKGYDY